LFTIIDNKRLDCEIGVDVGSENAPTFNNYQFKEGVEYEVRKAQQNLEELKQWVDVATLTELKAAPYQRIRLGVHGRDVIVWYFPNGAGKGKVYELFIL
jgi:hypothetical protein